ncbi:MAG TPA: DUF188 domain-containing protein [bacterium]|nr:DUF188 domain-containing protein [bacterium]
MRLLVDGDASGQRDLLMDLASEYGALLVWVHNPSHRPPQPRPGLLLEVHLADGGPQAADVVVMNFAGVDDIVVTGDLGLALVCVAKGAAAISPRGFWFKAEDMEQRMEFRALAARLKRGGEYLHHKPPQRRLDDWRFEQELRRALAR